MVEKDKNKYLKDLAVPKGIEAVVSSTAKKMEEMYDVMNRASALNKAFTLPNSLQYALDLSNRYNNLYSDIFNNPQWLKSYSSIAEQLSGINFQSFNSGFEKMAFSSILENTLIPDSLRKTSMPLIDTVTSFNNDLNSIVFQNDYIQQTFVPLNTLKFNSIVCCEKLSDEVVEAIPKGKSINELLDKFFIGDNEDIIDYCLGCDFIKDRKKLFSEIVSNYKKEEYTIATIAITTIIDGCLTYITKDTRTNFVDRGKKVLELLKNNANLNDKDFKIYTLELTIERIMNDYTIYADFSEEDDNSLNRHRLIHGRTKKECNKYEFAKLLRFLYGLLIIESMK